MDLGAIKAARRTELAACAMATARNAQGLLHDAEVLAERGCVARAYSLAVLAVEECGKAVCLCVLAMLPRAVRTRAPAGRLLQWHQLKQVGGLLTATVTLEEPGMAVKLASMPATQASQIVASLSLPADEADRLKRRGMYVDMDRVGRIREPAEITQAEATRQLARARRAVASTGLLLGPQAQARLEHPRRESIQICEALVYALIRAGSARTPDAAVAVMLNAVRNFHATAAITGADGVPRSRRPAHRSVSSRQQHAQGAQARVNARAMSQTRTAPRPRTGRGTASPPA